jgi:ubiquinone/menaquinone biosynthesis C-methylase UbiE
MEEGNASPGEAWKSAELVRKYLGDIRGAIPLAAEQIEVMLRVLGAREQALGRLLDVGCGNGVLSAAVMERHPGSRATLVDFSEPMLEAARTNLAPFGERCRIVAADLSSGEWSSSIRDDGPFDAVVSGFAIHHLTDERKRALYGEVFGLLKPGGVFVNGDHVSSATTWLESVFNDLLIDSFHAHQVKRGSGMTREQVAAEYVNRDDRESNLLAPVEEQCRWLREIGFQDVDCYMKLFELAVFGGRKPEGGRS